MITLDIAYKKMKADIDNGLEFPDAVLYWADKLNSNSAEYDGTHFDCCRANDDLTALYDDEI